jgi:hypothetical protein
MDEHALRELRARCRRFRQIWLFEEVAVEDK